MEKYGNWLRIKIGLGCLFGIRYVFFFPIFLLYLSTPPHPVIGLFFSFCRWKENVVWNSFEND